MTPLSNPRSERFELALMWESKWTKRSNLSRSSTHRESSHDTLMMKEGQVRRIALEQLTSSRDDSNLGCLSRRDQDFSSGSCSWRQRRSGLSGSCFARRFADSLEDVVLFLGDGDMMASWDGLLFHKVLWQQTLQKNKQSTKTHPK